MRTALYLAEQAAMPVFSPMHWIRCFTRNPFSTGKLFTPETIQLFTTRALPADSSRALGWDTPSLPSSSGKFFSRHSAGHLGYAGTSLWIDFERQLAVVLLTNRTWPHRQTQAIRTIRPAFHDAVLKQLGKSETKLP